MLTNDKRLVKQVQDCSIRESAEAAKYYAGTLYDGIGLAGKGGRVQKDYLYDMHSKHIDNIMTKIEELSR